MTEQRRAWDRRSGEHSRAYAAFKLYLDLGPQRTLPQVADRLGLHLDTVKGYSRKHDWRIRAAAHDDHMNMLYWQGAEGEAAELGRRHGELGQQALRVVSTELAYYAKVQELRAWLMTELPADPREDDEDTARLRRWCMTKMLSGRDMATLIKAAGDLEHRVVVTEGALGSELHRELDGLTPDELRDRLTSYLPLTADELKELGL